MDLVYDKWAMLTVDPTCTHVTLINQLHCLCSLALVCTASLLLTVEKLTLNRLSITSAQKDKLHVDAIQ
jgi:hypothetical protein